MNRSSQSGDESPQSSTPPPLSDDPPPPEPHQLPPPESVWWPRTHEEEWAKRAHRPTHILGWLLIATELLAILAAIIPGAVPLEFNFIGLIAGAYILGGNQAWLRFMTFLLVVAAGFACVQLLATLVFDLPFETSHGRSHHRADATLWTQGVPLVGWLLFEAVLAVAALRTRRLAYWTRTSKRWSGIAAALILVGLGIAAWQHYREWKADRDLRAELSLEIETVKRHLDSGGTSSDPEPVLRATPRIQTVYWNPDPPHFSAGSMQVIYDREPPLRFTSTGNLTIPYTTPGGQAGALVFHLDPPP